MVHQAVVEVVLVASDQVVLYPEVATVAQVLFI
jgi:hypothetical protein